MIWTGPNDAPLSTKEERMAAFKRQMDAEPCLGCYTDAHPEAVILEGIFQCRACGLIQATSYGHTCITGWRQSLCRGCNAKMRERVARFVDL